MRDTLRRRPESDDIWVFGYGSLILNPVCRFGSQQKATLEGWLRRFCLRTIAGRPSTRLPGRMLSLEPGGRTEGVVLRVPTSQRNADRRLSTDLVAGSDGRRHLPHRPRICRRPESSLIPAQLVGRLGCAVRGIRPWSAWNERRMRLQAQGSLGSLEEFRISTLRIASTRSHDFDTNPDPETIIPSGNDSYCL